MSSLTALMASLPPASLAETDLARFCALAIGRRSRSELQGLAAAFGEEALRGYAPSLGPILQALTLTVVQHGLDPNALDARIVDGLLGSAAFLARLEKKVSVSRQRLRPGTIVASGLRQTLGTRLLVLPGVGKELVLVAPVDLARVPDAHFAVPLGVVLARPAPAEEAEVLRSAWAVIEERFGLDGEEAAEWTSRFLAISRRENHDARTAAEGLARLEPAQRAQLWEALVAHLRDCELPDQHRTGRRGLERRLDELGFVTAHGVGAAAPPDWVEATFSLVESVYRAAGLDPEVMAGRCPVTSEDVERWSAWVDVPVAGRERVRKLSTEAIAMALVRLAEEEAGRMERVPEAMPEPVARALASLRDRYLRPRWQRSRWALIGLDPLTLARARIASGEDTHAIRDDLEALARDANNVERQPPRLTRSKAPRPGAASSKEPATPPPESEESSAGEAPASALELEPASPAQDPARAPERPAAEEPDPVSDGRGLRPSRFHLPPLPPVPPPRPAPRVRPRTDFPPMPSARPRTKRGPDTARAPVETPATPSVAPRIDPAAPHEARAPSQRVVTARVHAQPSPASALPTRPAHTSERVELASPRIARPRTGATAAHLVTPTQGNEFYDASFRELELIERDLVQRGPYAGAAERVQAIAAEAAELHSALGPSARSGDREFQAAQRRIEKVQAYLERVGPLLVPHAGDPLAHQPDSDSPGFFGRLFGKRGRR